jgi:hypothetical protein
MKLHPKLEGLPPVYYFNLDRRKDRREYLEQQFSNYGIQNYFRVNSSRYSVDNYDEWKSRVVIDKLRTKVWFLATLIDRIRGVIDWYNSGISETCLLVEDDISFELVEYWNFDWKTLMSRLPCNWECLQLHIIGNKFVSMNMSKWFRNNHSTGCILINRSYAKRLIDLHYVNDKFVLYSNYGYGKSWPQYHYQSVDFVMYQIGITYSLPILTTNSRFISDGYRNNTINNMAKNTDEIVFDWWKTKSKKYLISDLTCLDSPKRNELIFKISHEFKS